MVLKTDSGTKRTGNPLVYLFRKMWRYSEDGQKTVLRFWIVFVIAQIVSTVFQPLIFARMIDVIQKQGITSTNIRLLLGLLGLVVLARLAFWVLHGPARVIERRNAFRVRSYFRKYLLRGVMTLPMEWHAEHHSGDTTDKIEKGTEALFNFSQDSYEFIYAGVQLAVSYGMLAYVSPSSAYIVFGILLFTAWTIMKFDRVLLGHYRELNRGENNISESVIDAITNITTVIILRVERLVFEAIEHKIDKPYELFARNVLASEIKWFIANMYCVGMIVLVLGAYFHHNIGAAQGILLGNLYLLMKYLDQVSALAFDFCAKYGEVLKRKAKVLNAQELAEDFRAESFANHVLRDDWQRVEMSGLTFSYQGEGGDTLHLNNASLSMRRGERIALVGESGSGKTTLLKVMRDLHHPKSIQLWVDGCEIPQGFAGICRAITLIPQASELFAKSVFENITLGAEYSREFVRRFTDMACITSVIEGLPRGFDSLIQERGVNLSGGQQQRLALARGFLAAHDKQILLLDEPTSGLDPVNEWQIYRNVFLAFREKTIISTVHHLDLLSLFDRICFCEHGRIVASGTLADLMATCPAFQAFVTQPEGKRNAASA